MADRAPLEIFISGCALGFLTESAIEGRVIEGIADDGMPVIVTRPGAADWGHAK